eukprot:TRINITY_DN30401_c0_g1_i1.p1 TRINITY_DN30401_c0_g1~~TRINITY_DN30401_c0_g1_i1.p1  ORF type:complete len:363 (-),score=27.15 TRINITY_DN30401_c0_g1_i1:33-1121(-)
MTSQARPIPKVLGDGQFEVESVIGQGCFGVVYRGREAASGVCVAVKYEPCKEKSMSRSCLTAEAEVLMLLQTPKPVHGFTRLHYICWENDYACMVVDLLGKSLEDCVVKCKGRLNAQTTAIVGEQAMWCTEYLHSKCFLHRDIKPENFMWGVGGKIHHLHLIDFGLSCRYYNVTHVPMTTGHHLTGTVRYASISCQKGFAQSRRDDLESIGHLLMYCLRGALPWSGLKVKNDSLRNKAILDKKLETSLGDLCAGHPDEFLNYLTYCRSLPFKAIPNYAMLRSLFRAVRQREGGVEDYDLQWLKREDINPDTLVAYSPPDVDECQQPDAALEHNGSSRRRPCCFVPLLCRRTSKPGPPSMETE